MSSASEDSGSDGFLLVKGTTPHIGEPTLKEKTKEAPSLVTICGPTFSNSRAGQAIDAHLSYEWLMEHGNVPDDVKEELQAPDRQIPPFVPKLVFSGDEDAGKSETAACLIGMKFLPKRTARAPIVGRLYKCPEELMIDICKGVTTKDGATGVQYEPGMKLVYFGGNYYCGDTDLCQQVEEAMEQHVRKANGALSGCVDEPLHIDVYSALVPNLELIELPGNLIQSPVDDPTFATQAQQLTKKYLNQNDTLIVVVHNGMRQLSLSKTIKLVNETADKPDSGLRKRMVGVFTHADQAVKLGGKDLAAFKARLATKGNHLLNESVVIGLANTEPADKDKPDNLEMGTVDEDKIFNIHFQDEYKNGIVGRQSLVQAVVKMVNDSASATWAELSHERNKLRDRIVRSKLIAMGPAPPTKTDSSEQVHAFLEGLVMHALSLLSNSFQPTNLFQPANDKEWFKRIRWGVRSATTAFLAPYANEPKLQQQNLGDLSKDIATRRIWREIRKASIQYVKTISDQALELPVLEWIRLLEEDQSVVIGDAESGIGNQQLLARFPALHAFLIAALRTKMKTNSSTFQNKLLAKLNFCLDLCDANPEYASALTVRRWIIYLSTFTNDFLFDALGALGLPDSDVNKRIKMYRICEDWFMNGVEAYCRTNGTSMRDLVREKPEFEKRREELVATAAAIHDFQVAIENLLADEQSSQNDENDDDKSDTGSIFTSNTETSAGTLNLETTNEAAVDASVQEHVDGEPHADNQAQELVKNKSHHEGMDTDDGCALDMSSLSVVEAAEIVLPHPNGGQDS